MQLTKHIFYLFTVSEGIAATTMVSDICIKVIVVLILFASHKNHYKIH